MSQSPPSNTDLLRSIFFGQQGGSGSKKATPSGVFDPTTMTSSVIMRSVFNKNISGKWDQFLTEKNKRDNPAPIVTSPSSPSAAQDDAKPKRTTPEELTQRKENKDLVLSSKEQVAVTTEVRDELQGLNKNIAEIMKKGLKVTGDFGGGGGDDGFSLMDLLGGGKGGKPGGKPSLLRRAGGGLRRFAGTRGGKFAIGGAILAGGAWGLSKLFGGDDEEAPEGYEGSDDQLTGGAGDYAGAVGGAVAPTVALAAGKSLVGTGASTVAKTAAKAGGKSLFTSFLKKIPGVGAIVGTGLAIGRALEGDFAGAVGEFASGVASTVPGLGTLASVAIDGGLAIRDVNKALEEQEGVIQDTTAEQSKLSERMADGSMVTDAIGMAIPAMGLGKALSSALGFGPGDIIDKITENFSMSDVMDAVTKSNPLLAAGNALKKGWDYFFGDDEDESKLSERMNPNTQTSVKDMQDQIQIAVQAATEIAAANQDQKETVSSDDDGFEKAIQSRYYDMELSEMGEQTSLFEKMVDALSYLKDKATEGVGGFGGFGSLLGGILGGGAGGGLFSSVSSFFSRSSSSGFFSGPTTPSSSSGSSSSTGSAFGRQRRDLGKASESLVDAMSASLQASTQNAIDRGVRYGFGSKNSKTGAIDCSGWVAEMNKSMMDSVNEELDKPAYGDEAKRILRQGSAGGAAGIIKAVTEATGEELRNADLTPDKIREGIAIGMDTGDRGWDRGRHKGIDHIVQTYRDPKTGQMMVSESKGGKGVTSTSYDEWYAKWGDRAQLYGADVTKLADASMFEKGTQQPDGSVTQVADGQQKQEGQTAEKSTEGQPTGQMTAQADPAKTEMSFYDYLKTVEKKRLTREGDYGLGDDFEAAEERYQAYLKEKQAGQSVTPEVTDGKQLAESTITPTVNTPPPQSALNESVRIESAMAQQRAAQSSASSMTVASAPSSPPPSIGNQAGPIPDGGYDKLTAVARGDTV